MTENSTKFQVAIKQIKTPEGMGQDELMRHMEDFYAEAEIMKSLPPHPNVIRFIGRMTRPPAIITEYAGGGSLLGLLKQNPTLQMSRR